MPGELKKQFSLTRAALSTCRAQKQIPISDMAGYGFSTWGSWFFIAGVLVIGNAGSNEAFVLPAAAVRRWAAEFVGAVERCTGLV
jgi:hypothetical protein